MIRVKVQSFRFKVISLKNLQSDTQRGPVFI